MKLGDTVVLLTGATGGIGAALAHELLQRGARVLLTARDASRLESLRQHLGAGSTRIGVVAADLTSEADRRRLLSCAMSWQGGIDVLINNAGASEFGRIENQSCEQLAALVATNLTAPMQLTREALPYLLRKRQARIVNVGSVYGAIGYPGFGAYCATKFGLRGFSEALRRELAGGPVSVHYLAPRATRTSMNSAAVDAMNERLGAAVDPPSRVAQAVCRMIERGNRHAVIGWPEKLFVRVNALLPWLVDASLRQQLPIIRRYADAARARRAADALSSSADMMRTSA